MGQGHRAKARTRAPGLDGVRAIAVLAVIGYHEGARALTGGFLGVDVFFVLSGFLITDLLITQRPTLKDFWLRRARRLLPALAVMLVLVAAAATIIEPGAVPALRAALLAAITYTSNWYQMLHHVSYFDTFGPPPPLEHLWSLAIEEQFYLIWPLILWFLIIRLNGWRAWITATLLGAAGSALAMAILYRSGNPSMVYYGTDTHASALLIGAALALACPLATLTSAKADMTSRLDAIGMAGLAVLAWAFGHFSGNDAVVYPAGLLIAALAAAAIIAAAASRGAVAAITSVAPMRWIGVRSYAMYLWHWPVIALTAALAGKAANYPGTWIAETAITVGLAAASWRFVEAPILRDGFRSFCANWYRSLAAALFRPKAGLRQAFPMAVSVVALLVMGVACYGVAVPAGSSAQTGLLRQVAEGERISAVSHHHAATSPATQAPRATSSPRAVPTRTPVPRPGRRRAVLNRTACRPAGWQITAIGDSVMLASASALEAGMPGVYLDAKVGRQMQAGVQVVQGLAATGGLRRYVVVGLGTNGVISPGEILQLRDAVGPHRELILVNTFGPMSWESEVNNVLAAATWHKPDVELVNWAQAIAPYPNLLWSDGIHPRPSGASLYARLVANAIRASC
ncbi:MAG TPA: acyltransferase family protein [Streptosporangiaceae bacterium]